MNDDRGASARERAGARTVAFVRAELTPLAVGRARAAALVDELLRARVERGDYAASNCGVARVVGVAEKQIRQWRSGAKPLPFGVVFALPVGLARELLGTALQSLAALRDDRRSVESRLRRIVALVGELAAGVEDAGVPPFPASVRRSLRLRALRLIDEAERLARHLSEDPC